MNIWLNCDEFLWKDEFDWPVDPVGLLQIPPQMTDERYKEVAALCFAVESTEDSISKMMTSTSSWIHLSKIFAWWSRIQQLFRKTNLSDHAKVFQPLTTEDIDQAGVNIARFVQQKVYHTEYNRFESATAQSGVAMEVLPKSSALWRHHPIMFQTDRVLRANTRMENSQLPFDTKYPIIMPSNHHVTKLFIIHFHLKVIHMGLGTVISAISEKFWIVGGNKYVKKVIGKCFDCKLWNQPPEQQIMGPLPECRVTVGWFAFEHTGVDYFGPFYVKRGRAQVKRWGCVFTCMKIRAIHLEVAHSLDTDSFLCAFFRFVARRGPPKELYSDNGTNFVGAQDNVTAALKK